MCQNPGVSSILVIIHRTCPSGIHSYSRVFPPASYIILSSSWHINAPFSYHLSHNYRITPGKKESWGSMNVVWSHSKHLFLVFEWSWHTFVFLIQLWVPFPRPTSHPTSPFPDYPTKPKRQPLLVSRNLCSKCILKGTVFQTFTVFLRTQKCSMQSGHVIHT